MIEDDDDTGVVEALAKEEEPTNALLGAALSVGVVSGGSKIVVM